MLIGYVRLVTQDKMEQVIYKCTKYPSQYEAIKNECLVLLCKQITTIFFWRFFKHSLDQWKKLFFTIFDWSRKMNNIEKIYMKVSASKIWNESNRKVINQNKQLLLTFLVLKVFLTKKIDLTLLPVLNNSCERWKVKIWNESNSKVLNQNKQLLFTFLVLEMCSTKTNQINTDFCF